MSRKEQMEALFSRLQSDLTLSEEQGSKLRGLIEDHFEQRRAVRESNDEKEARRQAIKPLMKELRQNIGGMLDAGQKATFQANKEEYRDLLRG